MTKGYLGIDIGSISTKGVIIDENRAIIARSYLWTEGNPTEASKNVVRELERQVEGAGVDIVGAGTTGSARRLVGAMLGASVIKNEITAHAVAPLICTRTCAPFWRSAARIPRSSACPMASRWTTP